MPGPGNALRITEPGYVIFDGVDTFHGRTFQAGAGITLTNPDGISGNTTISLTGGGVSIDSIGTQTGTNPIIPTNAGLVTINGAVVAAGTNPVRSDGTGPNTMALEVQISQAIGAADATKIGLSNFDSAAFDVDANGFVQLNGGGIAATSFTVDANTAPGTNPVVPSAAGSVTIEAAAVAAHSVPIETRSRAVNTFKVEVQEASAVAATDATKSGISHFNSANFTVDASGFVSASGSVATTYTGDSGASPAVPSAGNLNIFGLSGIQTSTSGSTVTIKGPPFLQVGASATSAKNTGEFVTAAVTRTLPVSAGLIDGDLFIYVCTTAGALVIQAVGSQKIMIGSTLSTAAGTATSNSIGDSLTLRFNATDEIFYAVSAVGTWTLST